MSKVIEVLRLKNHEKIIALDPSIISAFIL